jgi:hypothetical protein
MKGAPLGGFTVVEVMIVLAISAVMLLTALTAFSGKKETTYFSQAVYDLRSQLQSWANDVSSQSVPGIQQFTCTPKILNGVMRPTLTPGNTTNQDCIYLGQAIQVAPGRSTLISYPVFGLRTIYNGSTDSGEAPTTPADAHAEPAVDDMGTIVNQIKTTYALADGMQVVSAQLNGTESDILTMYSNLKSNNTNGNEIDVAALPVAGDSASPDSQIIPCIESSGACNVAGSAATSNSWKLCVSYGSKQALISLKGTPSGIVTQLNLQGCA